MNWHFTSEKIAARVIGDKAYRDTHIEKRHVVRKVQTCIDELKSAYSLDWYDLNEKWYIKTLVWAWIDILDAVKSDNWVSAAGMSYRLIHNEG